MGKPWGANLKSLVDHWHLVKYKSTSIKTLWPACTATSSKDRHIRAYYFGLNIPRKLGCPNKKTLNRDSCPQNLWKLDNSSFCRKSNGQTSFIQHVLLMPVCQNIRPSRLLTIEGVGAKLGEGMWAMGLYHTLDGITSLKYKLLCLFTPNTIIF